MKSVIFDIDGTLADASHRLHYIVPAEDTFSEFKKDWDNFLDQAKNDAPKWDIINILNIYYKAGYIIVLCTGRKESNRADTEHWLARHGIEFNRLFMRATKDRRLDAVVKAELYEDCIKHNFGEIEAVYEDRDRVVEMWREKGLTCLQVQKGDY